jgi:hypothetical protein
VFGLDEDGLLGGGEEWKKDDREKGQEGAVHGRASENSDAAPDSFIGLNLKSVNSIT